LAAPYLQVRIRVQPQPLTALEQWSIDKAMNEDWRERLSIGSEFVAALRGEDRLD
jgi:hypothetical protein